MLPAWVVRRDLVRPERFELPTCCSGGNRSIQLSYGRARIRTVYTGKGNGFNGRNIDFAQGRCRPEATQVSSTESKPCRALLGGQPGAAVPT
jgi:hypothetical protein